MNSKGEFCCDVADCRRPYAWRMTAEGYEVEVASGTPWLKVPAENVLRRVNLLGEPIACIVRGEVRCFVPPSET